MKRTRKSEKEKATTVQELMSYFIYLSILSKDFKNENKFIFQLSSYFQNYFIQHISSIFISSEK